MDCDAELVVASAVGDGLDPALDAVEDILVPGGIFGADAGLHDGEVEAVVRSAFEHGLAGKCTCAAGGTAVEIACCDAGEEEDDRG